MTKDCKHPAVWFSRCIEYCEHDVEGMHYYCTECGKCVDSHSLETCDDAQRNKEQK